MTKTFKNLICKSNIESFIMMEEIKHNRHFKSSILQRVAEKRKNKTISNNLLIKKIISNIEFHVVIISLKNS